MAEFIALIFQLLSSTLSIIWSVLPVIGMWLVFEKAGERGWKAIIPFYNMYILFKIGDRQKYWKLYLIGCILYTLAATFTIGYCVWAFFAFLSALGGVDLGWEALGILLPGLLVAGIAVIVGGILMLIANIHGYSGICKKMGQDSAMVVGLIFLPQIFWMILGAGKSFQWEQPTVQEYQAPVYTPQEWQDPYTPQSGESGESTWQQ